MVNQNLMQTRHTVTITANIAESTLPVIYASIRLSAIDGEVNSPEEKFELVKMLWDTRAMVINLARDDVISSYDPHEGDSDDDDEQ